jgi:transcriptional regulator with XRE-family HTH domain
VRTFGHIIAEARKALGISQKDLAARIRKEDGHSISPQYLNDIEHDRRDPPGEFLIDQFAKHLRLSREHLIAAAGRWPSDLRQKLADADPKRVEEAFTAFRRVLKEKP